MLFNSSARRRSVVTALGILTLALAVFGWGVQYKLSLYDAPSGHTVSVAQAKLLSPKERSVAARAPAMFLPDTQAPLAVVLAFITIASLGLFHGPSARRAGSREDDPLGIDRRVSSTYFSFRPPPALFPLTF